jgi:hypothetical protein
MTGRIVTRGRLVAAAAGAVIVMVVVPASAASATTTTNIVITTPSPGTSFTSGVTSASVPISGNANIVQQPLERNVVNDLQVSVTFGGAQVFSCAHSADCGATNGAPSTNFSFTPVVTRNGPYSVSALVSGTECNVLNSCVLRSSTATTNFNVGVHPVAPRNVRAQVNGDRSVTVSWSANPEPDVFGYQILRRDPGSSSNRAVNSFLSGTSWTDQGTVATGGDYGYIVIAFRPGADGTSTATTVLSTSSGAAAASVPAPPVPSTTVPVGDPVGAATTTTVAAPLPPAGPDLSAFLDQAAKAGAIPVAPPKVVVPHAASPAHVGTPSIAAPAGPPDTYAPTLPYSAPAIGAPQAGGGGDSPQVALPGPVAKSHQHRSLLYSVAGGLFLCVLGLAVRTANRRPGAPPLEPLTDRDRDGGGGGAAVIVPASASAKAAARAAALVAAGGDAAALTEIVRAASSEDAVAAATPAESNPVAAPAGAVAAVAASEAAFRPTGRAGAARAPAAGRAASAVRVPTAGRAAAGRVPAGAPAAGRAGAAPVPAAAVPLTPVAAVPTPSRPRLSADRPPAPAHGPVAALPGVGMTPQSGRPSRGKETPSTNEAVDYFRLIRDQPPGPAGGAEGTDARSVLA